MGAYLRKDRRQIADSMEKLMVLFPAVKAKLNAAARELSGGQQQMVAIARGLMAVPELLMLDEPSLGLSPLIRQQLAEIIKTVSQDGTTMVLVEQNARLGLMLANYGYVMENGELVLQGKTDELMQDDKVKKAYLGV
jgi:branched-chain amino acid transport system ATP-binding protein